MKHNINGNIWNAQFKHILYLQFIIDPSCRKYCLSNTVQGINITYMYLQTGCKTFYCVYYPRLYVFLFFLFSLSSFSDFCLAKAHTILSFSVSRLFEAHKTIQIITAMISSTVATTCYKRKGWYIEWLWWVQLCYLSITSDIFQPPNLSNTI